MGSGCRRQQSRGHYVLASGAMVETAKQALVVLSEAGIQPTLINARSIKPLDEKLLASLLSQPGARIVTVEEGVLTGGFGSAVLEYGAKLRFSKPGAKLAEVACIALPDQFVEHGARPILLDLVGLSVAKITQTMTEFFKA
jgi:1-deoxy-D-xylulose-5-phosphate synthase